MTDSGSVDMGSIPVGGTRQYSERLAFHKSSVYFSDRQNIVFLHSVNTFARIRQTACEAVL